MSANKRSSLEKYHLKQRLKELGDKRSFNMSTSLVTLYIPPGTQLSSISAKLKDELGTATNIKDKATGKAVADALRSILSRMQYLKNTENGLAIFAGITEESQKLEYYAIDPPKPITIKDYLCDSAFDIEHLKSMVADRDELGIIVIDRGGATFATIRGSHLNFLYHKDSFVPSKHNKGGQSAGRIERGIEILTQEFYGKMAETANKYFVEEYPVAAIVVGGPAMSKDRFLEHPKLDYRLRDKIYKVYDVGYTGESGVRELLVRAEGDLDDYALIHERNLFQRFLEELGKDEGKAIYGEAPVLRALKLSAVETVLFSEGIERINLKIVCDNCDKKFTETTTVVEKPAVVTKIKKFPCPQCKQEKLSVDSTDLLIDDLEKLAIESGATLELISTGHEDGLMLLKTFTGIGALLRFPVDWD